MSKESLQSVEIRGNLWDWARIAEDCRRLAVFSQRFFWNNPNTKRNFPAIAQFNDSVKTEHRGHILIPEGPLIEVVEAHRPFFVIEDEVGNIVDEDLKEIHEADNRPYLAITFGSWFLMRIPRIVRRTYLKRAGDYCREAGRKFPGLKPVGSHTPKQHERCDLVYYFCFDESYKLGEGGISIEVITPKDLAIQKMQEARARGII